MFRKNAPTSRPVAPSIDAAPVTSERFSHRAGGTSGRCARRSAADESREQDGRDGEQHQRPRRSPAVGRGAGQGEDEREEPGDQRGAAEHVKAAAVVGGARRRDDVQRGQADGDADRDVDEEDPVPAQQARQHAAGEHADRHAGAGQGAPDPERGRPLRAGVGRGDDRERGGEQHRRADALERAGDDQRGGRPRQAAGERCGGEDHSPIRRIRRRPPRSASRPPRSIRPPVKMHVGRDDPGEVAGPEAQAGRRSTEARRSRP